MVLLLGLILLWAGSRLKWEAKGGPKPLGLILGEALLLIVAVLLLGLILFGTALFQVAWPGGSSPDAAGQGILFDVEADFGCGGSGGGGGGSRIFIMRWRNSTMAAS